MESSISVFSLPTSSSLAVTTLTTASPHPWLPSIPETPSSSLTATATPECSSTPLGFWPTARIKWSRCRSGAKPTDPASASRCTSWSSLSLSTTSGKSLRFLLSRSPKSFNVPHALALAEDKELVCVADRENSRVVCFNISTGKHVKTLQPDEMGRVYSIAYSQYDGIIDDVTNFFQLFFNIFFPLPSRWLHLRSKWTWALRGHHRKENSGSHY